MSDRFDHRLEHKLESKCGSADGGRSFRRLELITGTGRRRQCSADEKARILLESLEPGANVSEVARRHGIAPQQLFGWRRQARAGQVPPASGRRRGRGRPRRERDALQPATEAPAFVPVVIAPASSPASPPPPSTGAMRIGHIEIAIGDTVVRVVGQVEAALLVTVLRAVGRAS